MSFEAEHVRYGTKKALSRVGLLVSEAESKEKHAVYMQPSAGVDYNLTLCPLQSLFHQIYSGEPYARVEFTPVGDFGFGLWLSCKAVKTNDLCRYRDRHFAKFERSRRYQDRYRSLLGKKVSPRSRPLFGFSRPNPAENESSITNR